MRKLKLSEVRKDKSKRVFAVLCMIWRSDKEKGKYIAYETISYAPTEKGSSGHIKTNVFDLEKPEDYTVSVSCENVTVIIED